MYSQHLIRIVVLKFFFKDICNKFAFFSGRQFEILLYPFKMLARPLITFMKIETNSLKNSKFKDKRSIFQVPEHYFDVITMIKTIHPGTNPLHQKILDKTLVLIQKHLFHIKIYCVVTIQVKCILEYLRLMFSCIYQRFGIVKFNDFNVADYFYNISE